MTDSIINNLYKEYLEKVCKSNSSSGSRNVIIITQKSEDEVLQIVHSTAKNGNRVITNKKVKIIDNIHIIELRLKSVIKEELLNKHFEYVIAHGGYLKEDCIIDKNEDDRMTQYYKKICNDNNIKIDDFYNLPKKIFFQRYKKITMTDKAIEAVNAFHETKRIEDVIKEYQNIVFKPFQQTVLDILKTKPHKRNIYIVQDEQGNIGKSFLCVYINAIYDILLVEGKTDNIYYLLSEMVKEGIDPEACILDIPRESQNFLQYSTIEKLKNGLVNSGKYKSMKMNIKPPHVFIFSNFIVSTENWTKDRIKYIDPVTGIITNMNNEIEDIYGNVIGKSNSQTKTNDLELTIDYKTMYYELESKYSKLKEEYEESKKK